MRKLVIAAVVSLLAWALGACAPDTLVYAAAAADGAQDLGLSDAPDAALPPQCRGTTCGDHGRCAANSQGISCICDPGFAPGGGLTCAPAGQCSPGYVRAAGQCVPAASLVQWCGDYCSSLGLACPPGVAVPAGCEGVCGSGAEAGQGCVADCLGALDQPGAAARTICTGLMRRMDSVDCRNLAHCEQALAAPACDALCDKASACGLTSDSRMLLGGSREECGLYCNALATALSPSQRFEPLRQCLTRALETCDPLGLAGCTVVGVAQLDGKLCSTLAETCQSIPALWPNQAACTAELQTWGAGPRIAAGGCLEIGGQSALCAEHNCASPPSALPVGAVQAAAAMLGHCPHLLAVPADKPIAAEFYAWMFVAVLKAFGKPIDRNYALISSCFLDSPCPATRDGTLQCLLSTPKE